MKSKQPKSQTRDAANSKVDDRQLLEAILLSTVQYRAACRRFNARVRATGFDRACSKLLDQIALRKLMIKLLAAEARGSSGSAAA